MAATGLYWIRSRQHTRLLLRFLDDLVAYDVRLLSISGTILDRALDVFPSHPLRAADAIHCATAAAGGEALAPDSFSLVGGDKEIAAAAMALGLSVIDPEAPDALDALASLRGTR